MGAKSKQSAKGSSQKWITVIGAHHRDYVGALLPKKEPVIALARASCGGEPFMRLHWAGWGFSTLEANDLYPILVGISLHCLLG